MAEDKREQILVRLEVILTALASDTDIHVYRDRADFDTEFDELPAYVLMDGSESAVLKSSDRRGPQIMALQAQIFYLPKPTANNKNEGMGPQLSAKRSAMIAAIMRDETLQNILGNNGYAEYRGMDTDMQTGGEVKGQFRMDFAFAYVLNFHKL